MITDCFVGPAAVWDISETEPVFVENVFALLKLHVPVAMSVFMWEIRKPGRPHHRPSMLLLEETTWPKQEQECS